MSPSKSLLQSRVPVRLSEIISREFEHAPLALKLFGDFLPRRAYCRDFALRLVGAARRGAGEPWEIRRLAALMLENQLLKLSADDVEEFDLLFTRLGLKSAPGVDQEMPDSMLKEGYTTTHLRGFVVEFRRKLERLNRVHDRMSAVRISHGALRDFIRMSRRECKISVARYLFRPDEVVERILGRLRTSRGVPEADHLRNSHVAVEASRALDMLPRYEAEILRGLCEAPAIYWVSDATSSEINSLVEYPLTTVVLVVKPPGSHVEFEIKRAGKRRGPLLGVVYEREGYTVPPPHRLDGGSMLTFLRNEAGSGATLSAVYRRVHASDAAMSRMVSRRSIFAVPVNGGEENILEYFTSPNIFGEGFDRMRAAMKECVYAFNHQDDSNAILLRGEFARAVQFVNHSTPGQAILSGTSSFRLDKVARYLDEQGPDIYFTQGLGVGYSKDDARRLADEVLEEVLGLYTPPAVPYRSHGQYVAAAFAVNDNRARADRIFLDSLRHLGKYWGTMLAIRGFSWGESFAPRNIGLKSLWSEGRWQTKITFMDHDCLEVAGRSAKTFEPVRAYNGIATDARYIGGGLIKTREQQTAIHFLKKIYRVRKVVAEEGKALFRDAIRAAYSATHDAASRDPDLRGLFNKVFVERLRDWDAVVASYLKMKSNGSDVEAWKETARRSLEAKGYGIGSIRTHLQAVEANSAFLERQAFLY
jgi:hypothetical protein